MRNDTQIICACKSRQNLAAIHMVKEAGYDESAKEIIALMAERLGR
ncbi:MAG: hypothetical protein IPK30_11990 [Cellvibrionales bacterium]|nr:hypothetical protein [Cellvibrionales bacterium]